MTCTVMNEDSGRVKQFLFSKITVFAKYGNNTLNI